MMSSSSTDRGQDHHALALELPGHRAGLGDRAAVLRQDRADLGAGAVAVVGEHLDEHGHAVRRVALVGDRLVDDALELAGAPLDGPLDGVERHRRVAGLLVHRAQRRVRVGVAAALAGRHLDLADQLGEELAPGLVRRALLVLDRRPLGVTRTSLATSWPRRRWTGTAGGGGGRRPARDGTTWRHTAPWRHSTGRPSTAASTSTSAPTRSTTGARMNTACTGGPSRPSTSRSASNESTWRPNALRRTAMSMAPKRPLVGPTVEHSGASRIMPAQVPRAGMPSASRAASGSNSSLSSSSIDMVVDSPAGDDRARRHRPGRRACAPRPRRHRARAARRRGGRTRPAGRGHRPSAGRPHRRFTSRGRRAWCRGRRSRGRASPHRGPG